LVSFCLALVSCRTGVSVLYLDHIFSRLDVGSKLGAGEGLLGYELGVSPVFLDHEGVLREGEVGELDANSTLPEGDVLYGSLLICSIVSD